MKRLTMSSHQNHVAAQRKPAWLLFVIEQGTHRPRRPNPHLRVPCGRACRQQGSRELRGENSCFFVKTILWIRNRLEKSHIIDNNEK
nr:hypothetical protein [Sporomusa silvacetica]